MVSQCDWLIQDPVSAIVSTKVWCNLVSIDCGGSTGLWSLEHWFLTGTLRLLQTTFKPQKTDQPLSASVETNWRNFNNRLGDVRTFVYITQLVLTSSRTCSLADSRRPAAGSRCTYVGLPNPPSPPYVRGPAARLIIRPCLGIRSPGVSGILRHSVEQHVRTDQSDSRTSLICPQG